MARTEAQRERHEYRKTQQMIEQTHGGNAGRSILEMLTEQLDAAMAQYLDTKVASPLDAVEVAMRRGVVRGVARAISTMQNPYRPTAGIKQLEKDSAARVRRNREGEAHTESA